MKTKLFCILFLILALPSVAQANAGTPLMWATIFHLLLGNAIIGIVEGLLLAAIFHTSKRKSIFLLIAANYASAWIGGVLIMANLASWFSVTIENVQFWFWVFIFLAFLITLLVEFPFVLLALRKIKNALKRAIVATLLLHCISYTLLIGYYWMVSGTSMITKLDVVSVDQMQVPEGYSIYYIAPDGGSVVRANLAGKTKESIKEVAAHHRNDRLFVRPRDEGDCDLFIRLDSEERNQEREELILEHFSTLAPVYRLIGKGHSEDPEGTWLNFGSVPKLDAAGDWEYYTGFWSVEGIYGKSEQEKSELHFSLETPFVSWIARNATHIKGNFLVFQLGNDQICILQPQTRQIALIAKGKGPVVAKTTKEPR